MVRNQDRDYVVATMLPYMPLEHEPNSKEEVRDFTVNEASELYVDDLPLLMNHNDGVVEDGKERPLDVIGKVEASNLRGAASKMLAWIEPTMSDAAMYSTNAVANGIYNDVSLGNIVDAVVRANGSKIVYRKIPQEVSLCERGRRYGSRIEAYCPGRTTIERLATDWPDDLQTLIRVHNYAADLSEMGVVPEQRAEYIDALVKLSSERLERTIQRENLYPRPRPQQTFAMSADDKSLGSEKMNASEDAAAASPPPAPPPAEKEGGGEKEAAAPPPPKAETAADVPDMTNMKKMAEAALKAREEAFDLRQRLAKTEERLAKGEEAEKRLAAIESEKAEKRQKQFETIIKSYMQHAAAAKTPQTEVDEEVHDCHDTFKNNPERGIRMAERVHRMAIRASEMTNSNEESEAQRLAQRTKMFNDNVLDTLASKWSTLNQREMSFAKAQTARGASAPASVPDEGAETAFDRRFKSSIADASAKQHESKTAAQEILGLNKRKAEEMMMAEKPAAPLFVRASENAAGDDDDEFDALAVWNQITEETGKIASLEQVMYVDRLVNMGRMQAGVNGDVPELKRMRLRQTPANIDPWNFKLSPTWANNLDKALMSGNFRERNARPLMMTSRAVPDVELPD